MRERFALFAFFSILTLVLQSCNRQSADLKPIHQQRSGEYVITVLNDTGMLKQRSDHLRLEFRNPANELADVSNVSIQASMTMPGMGPMFGNLSAPRQVGPGQYDVDADVGMAGQWTLLVTFDPNGRAQFALRAQ